MVEVAGSRMLMSGDLGLSFLTAGRERKNGKGGGLWIFTAEQESKRGNQRPLVGGHVGRKAKSQCYENPSC